MSYDGHGRVYQAHKPEQRNSSDTLKYTTYSYNADDSIETVTDGRGAVTAYTYNSRKLVTNIAWIVGSTGLADPTDVTFSYDNLGNRTQMTDGLGQVDYSYNELSQMTDETRDFADTLVDAPISGSKFKLEYTYTLSGSLKSYKDPYGQEIDYTHDKTGRLSTVTGSTFASVTNYASSPEYRAWGALKHLDYSNGNDLEMSYDNQLKPLTYELKRSSTVLMEKEYAYYQSGELKHVEGGVDNLITFDFAGRANKSKSGVEADGSSTATNLALLPFRHAFTYNSFNNLVDFDWTRWTDTGTETNAITNNRRGYYQEDDDGRDLTTGIYDAAGNNYFQGTETVQYYSYFDGERAESKRGVEIYNPSTELWEPVIYGYFIRSTVLGGQIVTEASATGKKTHTYVYAGGKVLAHQVIKIVSGSPQQSVTWEHRDPHNKRVQYMSTSGGQPSGLGLESGDVDSLGRMVGTLTYTRPSHDAENTISPFYQAPEPVGTGQCKTVQDAIYNNCSPQSIAKQIRDSNQIHDGSSSSEHGEPCSIPLGEGLPPVPGHRDQHGGCVADGGEIANVTVYGDGDGWAFPTIDMNLGKMFLERAGHGGQSTGDKLLDWTVRNATNPCQAIAPFHFLVTPIIRAVEEAIGQDIAPDGVKLAGSFMGASASIANTRNGKIIVSGEGGLDPKSFFVDLPSSIMKGTKLTPSFSLTLQKIAYWGNKNEGFRTGVFSKDSYTIAGGYKLYGGLDISNPTNNNREGRNYTANLGVGTGVNVSGLSYGVPIPRINSCLTW